MTPDAATAPPPRLIVIDDNPSIHRDFRVVLTRSRDPDDLDDLESQLFGAASAATPPAFEIDQALQGTDGITLVRDARAAGHPYALAFVDVRMPPGLDGIQTARVLLDVDPDLQLVICSAYSDYTWDQMAAVLGPGDRWLVLRKPFDAGEVRQLACALSHKWAQAREVRERDRAREDRVAARTRDALDAQAALRAEVSRRRRAEADAAAARHLETLGHLTAGIAREVSAPLQVAHDQVVFLRSAVDELTALLLAWREVTASRVPDDTARRLRALEAEADLAFLLERIPGAFAAATDGFDRMSRVVRSLIEFAHPRPDAPEHVDVNRAITTTLDIARGEYDYLAAVDAELGPLPPVRCHAAALHQALLGLVLTAAHAIHTRVPRSPDRGTIGVRSEVVGDEVVIRVLDDGAPWPVESPTAEHAPRSGPGLAFAHHAIVERHGGALTRAPRPEGGNVSTIRLAIDGPPAPPSSEE